MSTTDEPRVDLHVADGVAIVTITNPAKRNAMTAGMWRALPPMLDRLAGDPGVRVLVLTGAGDTFCAGADIGDLAGMGADTADVNLAVAAEQALAAFPRPTVARIAGSCVGGGCQLALACDIRIASGDARFGITPARLGIVYPVASTRRLIHVVGVPAAKALLLTGDIVDAGRALSMGLVGEVTRPENLVSHVDALARTLASRSSLSQTAMKEIIDALAVGAVDPDTVADWMAAVRDSGEAAEGAAAFMQRRAPRFPWRSGPR